MVWCWVTTDDLVLGLVGLGLLWAVLFSSYHVAAPKRLGVMLILVILVITLLWGLRLQVILVFGRWFAFPT